MYDRRAADAQKHLRQIFNQMDRAVVHGSTFAKNDLAMAAGIATLEVIKEERLVEQAARRGARTQAGVDADGAGLRTDERGSRQGFMMASSSVRRNRCG